MSIDLKQNKECSGHFSGGVGCEDFMKRVDKGLGGDGFRSGSTHPTVRRDGVGGRWVSLALNPSYGGFMKRVDKGVGRR